MLTPSNGQAFREGCGGRNFVTPNLIAYYDSGPFHIEISAGKGIEENSSPLFGVTVVASGKHQYTLCKAFGSLKEAEEYAEQLPTLRVETVR